MDRWYVFDIFHPISENVPHSLWGTVMWFSYVPRGLEARHSKPVTVTLEMAVAGLLQCYCDPFFQTMISPLERLMCNLAPRSLTELQVCEIIQVFFLRFYFFFSHWCEFIQTEKTT